MTSYLIITEDSDPEVSSAQLVPFESFIDAMDFAVKAAEVCDEDALARARKEVRDDNGTTDIYNLLSCFNDLSDYSIRVINGVNTAGYVLGLSTTFSEG